MYLQKHKRHELIPKTRRGVEEGHRHRKLSAAIIVNRRDTSLISVPGRGDLPLAPCRRNQDGHGSKNCEQTAPKIVTRLVNKEPTKRLYRHVTTKGREMVALLGTVADDNLIKLHQATQVNKELAPRGAPIRGMTSSWHWEKLLCGLKWARSI